MLEYMHNQGAQFAEAAATFAAAAGLEPGPTGGEGKGLLEKKWTSVVRLQRKASFVLACGVLCCFPADRCMKGVPIPTVVYKYCSCPYLTHQRQNIFSASKSTNKTKHLNRSWTSKHDLSRRSRT